MAEHDVFGVFNLLTLHVFSWLEIRSIASITLYIFLKIYKSPLFVYLNKHEEGSIALSSRKTIPD